MNPSVSPAVAADTPPAPGRGRRRLKIAAAIVAGIVILGVATLAAIWYFTTCGSCAPSPILCTDPCTLPSFSARGIGMTG